MAACDDCINIGYYAQGLEKTILVTEDQTYDLDQFCSVGCIETHTSSHSSRVRKRARCPLITAHKLCHSLRRGEIPSLRRLSCMWKDKRMTPTRMP
jgi:hypothetical protein